MNDRSFFETGDGCRIAYRFDGPADKPVLVLSNSIGTTWEMWDKQVAELSRYFRVLRYDLRSHGATSVPGGSYSVGRLGCDVAIVLRLHPCLDQQQLEVPIRWIRNAVVFLGRRGPGDCQYGTSGRPGAASYGRSASKHRLLGTSQRLDKFGWRERVRLLFKNPVLPILVLL
jgi:hypothetical protein